MRAWQASARSKRFRSPWQLTRQRSDLGQKRQLRRLGGRVRNRICNQPPQLLTENYSRFRVFPGGQGCVREPISSPSEQTWYRLETGPHQANHKPMVSVSPTKITHTRMHFYNGIFFQMADTRETHGLNKTAGGPGRTHISAFTIVISVAYESAGIGIPTNQPTRPSDQPESQSADRR